MVSGDTLGCPYWRGSATGIQWVIAGDAVTHPTTHRTASRNKESSSPECLEFPN